MSVIQRILPAGISDVLEVGCGQGALGTRLAQRYRYLGVEPDRASWAVAARGSARPGGEVRNIAVEDLGDERFDLVCAFEVLEHIEDDATALKEWSSRLRPGGWLLLSVPAHQHRYGPCDEIAGHFRRYDPAAMTALLTRCGFTEIQLRQYGFPLGYVLEAGRNLIGRGGSPRPGPVGRRADRRIRSAVPAVQRLAGCGHPVGNRPVPGYRTGVPQHRDGSRRPGPLRDVPGPGSPPADRRLFTRSDVAPRPDDQVSEQGE